VTPVHRVPQTIHSANTGCDRAPHSARHCKRSGIPFVAPSPLHLEKSASSRLLKKEFPQIRQKLWKEYFWSQSFCLLTTGGAPIEVIKKYIETQGQENRQKKR